MKPNKGKRGISKAQWLEKALEVFEEEGVNAVKVERLAARLNISRSGFYWHFKNRQDLLDQMLDYWIHEYTGVVTKNSEIQKLSPKDRLMMVMEMVEEYSLNRLELPIRAWAEHDEIARTAVTKAYKIRLKFAEDAFRELGFEGDELKMRSQLFIVYHKWANTTFSTRSKSERKRLRELRHILLTNK